MVDSSLKRADELKQALSDFVLDAEGELAVALETFSANESPRSQQQDFHKRSLVIDRFLTEGQVGESTPIHLFIAQEPELSASDRALLESWHHAFVGLFEIVQALEDGFELMSWTTTKHYLVKSTTAAQTAMARLKPGEIILTQIAPFTDSAWLFFGPWTTLGKLGKPKLAVAIGNFKDAYKKHLYSDAPDLLQEAWESVEQYHQQFIEFFGSDEVTLPGYQLSKKLAELQEKVSQEQLRASGFDGSKTLEEMAQDSGISKEELLETAETMGVDAKTVTQALTQKQPVKMAPSQVELPAHLKNAEQVTVLTHPHWGQTFLPTYARFQTLLDSKTDAPSAEAEKLVHHYLESEEINRFIWHRLAQRYPAQLETLLRKVLDRPEFTIQTDLDPLLNTFNKPIKPELPEIASVPLHLHTLFQDAVLELNKNKPKQNGKGRTKNQKASLGFSR